MGIPEEKLVEYRSQHKRIKVLATPGGTIVLRKPTRAEFKKYVVRASDDNASVSTSANEELALDIIVSHTRDQFIDILEEYPAIVASKGFNDAIRELTGATATAEGKDLAVVRARHKADAIAAVRNYQAFFRGEDSAEADAAGVEFVEFVRYQIAWVKAHEHK